MSLNLYPPPPYPQIFRFWVDLGFFCFINLPILPPPPLTQVPVAQDAIHALTNRRDSDIRTSLNTIQVGVPFFFFLVFFSRFFSRFFFFLVLFSTDKDQYRNIIGKPARKYGCKFSLLLYGVTDRQGSHWYKHSPLPSWHSRCFMRLRLVCFVNPIDLTLFLTLVFPKCWASRAVYFVSHVLFAIFTSPSTWRATRERWHGHPLQTKASRIPKWFVGGGGSCAWTTSEVVCHFFDCSFSSAYAQVSEVMDV